MERRDKDFEIFHDHYRPFVAAYITRRVDQDAVDDLTAEVFVVAWRRRREVPTDSLPWLYRTARNVIGTRYRSQERLEALRQKMERVPMERPADPAEAAVRRASLIAAFATMDEDDRELLLLVAWEGLSRGEIATALGISPGAAGVRLHRARARLAAASEARPQESSND